MKKEGVWKGFFSKREDLLIEDPLDRIIFLLGTIFFLFPAVIEGISPGLITRYTSFDFKYFLIILLLIVILLCLFNINNKLNRLKKK